MKQPTRVTEDALLFDASWIARCAEQTEEVISRLCAAEDTPVRTLLLRAVREVWKTELTPCQRNYFRAYYLEHRTMKEIAVQYGVTESTVSRTLHRARRRLQRNLAYYDVRLRSRE